MYAKFKLISGAHSQPAQTPFRVNPQHVVWFGEGSSHGRKVTRMRLIGQQDIDAITVEGTADETEQKLVEAARDPGWFPLLTESPRKRRRYPPTRLPEEPEREPQIGEDPPQRPGFH